MLIGGHTKEWKRGSMAYVQQDGLFLYNTHTNTWYKLDKINGDRALLRRSLFGLVVDSSNTIIICGGNVYSESSIVKLPITEQVYIDINYDNFEVTLTTKYMNLPEPWGWSNQISGFGMAFFQDHIIILGTQKCCNLLYILFIRWQFTINKR